VTRTGAKTNGEPGSPDRPDPGVMDLSAMHIKQLAQTVRYGRKVTFHVFDGDPVTGYLAGMDREYFLVLEPHHDGFKRWGIRRDGNPAFLLHGEQTYDSEAQKDALEEVIGPFRGWVNNRVLGNRNESDTRRAG
jgi:hypothetical protein